MDPYYLLKVATATTCIVLLGIVLILFLAFWGSYKK